MTVTISGPAEPLARFPAIRTTRVDEFAHLVKQVYGATGFDLPNPDALEACGNYVQLTDLSLGYGSCGTPIAIHFAETDFARLQLPLQGRGATRCGARSTLVDPNRPSMTSAGQPSSLDYGEGFAHLFLRIKSEGLARRLELLLGTPVRRALEFSLAEFSSPAALRGLWRLVDLVVRQLGDDESLLSPLAMRELEQAVAVQLLYATRHTYSARLEREPAETSPVHVQRAEAYIEANWDRAITLEDLAEVSGVSARSLFRAFEKARGCSPTIFAKRIRLERARDLLRQPEAETSVTATAFRCGFANLGHFGADYRRLFGELPSETLSRGRLKA